MCGYGPSRSRRGWTFSFPWHSHWTCCNGVLINITVYQYIFQHIWNISLKLFISFIDLLICLDTVNLSILIPMPFNIGISFTIRVLLFFFSPFSFFLEYKTIYWPLFTSICNKVNNIQLNNILITTKLLFFLASAELVTQNTEKVEPSCKEWIGVKSEKTCRSSID